MTLLPEVEDALMAAADRRARKPARPRRSRGVRGAVALLAALAVAGTAVAATSGWPPILGNGSDAIRPAQSPVPGDQSAALSVLRRPQTDADRGPDVQATLKSLPSGGESHGVRLDAVRRLAGGPTPGLAVILAPQERFGQDPPGPAGPRVKDALCVLYPSGPRTVAGGQISGAAVSCWTTREVLAGNAKGLAPAGDNWHFYGLVPDGVARVAITRHDGTTAQATVRDNFFDIPGPDGKDPNDVRAANPEGPARWLDADGNAVSPQS
jgi:hypothetical protein